jgi:hypothetical protein
MKRLNFNLQVAQTGTDRPIGIAGLSISGMLVNQSSLHLLIASADVRGLAKEVFGDQTYLL